MATSSDWMLLIFLPVEVLSGINSGLVWLRPSLLVSGGVPQTYLDDAALMSAHHRNVLFRTINIRTIFDLERAMPGMTIEDAPPPAEPALRAAMADVLARGCDRAMRKDFGLGDLPVMAQGEASLDRLGRLILDDLHVIRLRQVWAQIYDRFGRPVPEPKRP